MSSNPARAKFCLECGNAFASPVTRPASGARSPSLFADLSGFTAYSEGSDVEDVRAIAQETAGRLGDIVDRYGGTVDKIIGDCVMAVFGAPVAHEDDPERAVRAALDMQECVAENQERFAGMALCVGIQTGEAMWSPVGSDGRYTVLGDTVNTAARLQGAAGKGEISSGSPTLQRGRGRRSSASRSSRSRRRTRPNRFRRGRPSSVKGAALCAQARASRASSDARPSSTA